MNELTLITEGFKLNHSYTIESAAIKKSDLVVVIKDSEKDEFLVDFIKGKTAYKIAVNTDIAEIRIKHVVFVRSFLYGNDGNNQLLSFIIDLSPRN